MRSTKTTYYPGSYDVDDHRGGWADTMRSNPIPLAMIGLGIGWLALTGSGYDRRIAHSDMVRRAGSTVRHARDSVYGAAEHAYERAGDTLRQAGDRAGDTMNRARGMAGGTGGADAAHGMGDRMGEYGHEAAGRARSMAGGFWDMVDDHPLVAGVMGVALGAALGASIPSTRYENRWVGDYADEVYDQARHFAQDAIDRGTRAAKAAVETARDDVKEAVADVREAARDAVADTKNAAREEAKKPS
ncbi:hypothetical protein [Azospirillum halopraeferens]|uniref:hypothetical protein n=1 Tax=Azospirillum halopraeferens TaxID=34010 RepID=UPI0003F93C0D|nr:hypothetical protein [Azospirillum halopraeferens]